MSEQTCPDCGTGMEKGFVPDFFYAAVLQMVWHKGESEPAHFMGLKATGIKVSIRRSSCPSSPRTAVLDAESCVFLLKCLTKMIDLRSLRLPTRR